MPLVADHWEQPTFADWRQARQLAKRVQFRVLVKGSARYAVLELPEQDA